LNLELRNLIERNVQTSQSPCAARKGPNVNREFEEIVAELLPGGEGIALTMKKV